MVSVISHISQPQFIALSSPSCQNSLIPCPVTFRHFPTFSSHVTDTTFLILCSALSVTFRTPVTLSVTPKIRPQNPMLPFTTFASVFPFLYLIPSLLFSGLHYRLGLLVHW